MAKAKSKVEKKVKDIEESILDITDCQCGEEIKRIDQLEEYLVTAKDLIVVHDETIEKIEDSIKIWRHFSKFRFSSFFRL